MKGPVIQTNDDEFSEYVWMGEELEDFDNKMKNEYENEFWEEYFIEMCFEEMLDEEEEDEWFYPVLDLDIATLEKLQLRDVVKSSLNPLAPEFYPRSYSSSSEEDLLSQEDEGEQQR